VNVDRVRHRAEPLRDVLLGHPERQAAHLTIIKKTQLLTNGKKNLVKKSVSGIVCGSGKRIWIVGSVRYLCLTDM
jgi:hypothetical protein